MEYHPNVHHTPVGFSFELYFDRTIPKIALVHKSGHYSDTLTSQVVYTFDFPSIEERKANREPSELTGELQDFLLAIKNVLEEIDGTIKKSTGKIQEQATSKP